MHRVATSRVVAAAAMVLTCCVAGAHSRAALTPARMAFLAAFYQERSTMLENGMQARLFFPEPRLNQGRRCNVAVFSPGLLLPEPETDPRSHSEPFFHVELRMMRDPHGQAGKPALLPTQTSSSTQSSERYIVHICTKRKQKCSLVGSKVVMATAPHTFITVPLRLQREDLRKHVLLRVRIREASSSGKGKLLPCSRWPLRFEKFKPLSMLIAYTPQTNFFLPFRD